MPAPPPAPPPVLHGDCWRTFVAEAAQAIREIEARRAFDADVGAYLTAKNLVPDFEAWREARHAPKAT